MCWHRQRHLKVRWHVSMWLMAHRLPHCVKPSSSASFHVSTVVDPFEAFRDDAPSIESIVGASITSSHVPPSPPPPHYDDNRSLIVQWKWTNCLFQDGTDLIVTSSACCASFDFDFNCEISPPTGFAQCYERRWDNRQIRTSFVKVSGGSWSVFAGGWDANWN